MPLLPGFHSFENLLEKPNKVSNKVQVVVKIQLYETHAQDNNLTYEGEFHQEGGPHLEHIDAVALYYYDNGPNVKGGELQLKGFNASKHTTNPEDPKDQKDPKDPEDSKTSIRLANTDVVDLHVENGDLVLFQNKLVFHRMKKLISHCFYQTQIHRFLFYR